MQTLVLLSRTRPPAHHGVRQPKLVVRSVLLLRPGSRIWTARFILRVSENSFPNCLLGHRSDVSFAGARGPASWGSGVGWGRTRDSPPPPPGPAIAQRPLPAGSAPGAPRAPPCAPAAAPPALAAAKRSGLWRRRREEEQEKRPGEEAEAAEAAEAEAGGAGRV